MGEYTKRIPGLVEGLDQVSPDADRIVDEGLAEMLPHIHQIGEIGLKIIEAVKRSEGNKANEVGS